MNLKKYLLQIKNYKNSIKYRLRKLLSNYKILHIVNWNFNFNQTYDKLAIVKKK
jgi:hypothetical protein